MTRDRTGDPPKTAAELMAELQRDPAFAAREQERKRRQAENATEYQQAAAGILEDLAKAGFVVGAVGELRHSRLEYRKAVPVLLGWLPRISNASVKEDLVRTLSVPWARPSAAPALIREFEREDAGESLRWAIGNALEVVADESVVPDLLRLARETGYGKSREMLVLALGNAKPSAPVMDTLVELLRDEVVAVQAAIALGKLGAEGARPHLELVSRSAKGLLKKEAKRALEKL